MRKRAALVLGAMLCCLPAIAKADPQVVAACDATARATSLTWDDPGQECSDTFLLEAGATVVVHLEPSEEFNGTLGAALVLHETAAATFKRTFVRGVALDGSTEMTVNLGPGIWRMRAFAGVTPGQPCIPGPLPGWVPACNAVPGAALGFYRVTTSLA